MISIIVPTRNCATELPSHLAALKVLPADAAEIIFVDSESTDGTRELIDKYVHTQRHARVISHPPGLYASWNAGVAAAGGEWLNFATVGDTMRPDGLAHLAKVASAFRGDVIISPPKFRYAGARSGELRWPIHHFVNRLDELQNLQNLHRLTKAEKIRWFCAFLPDSLIGSSASNLYRRSFLLEHPFPVDFGHEGDAAWAASHCMRMDVLVTNTICAEFLVHGRGHDLTARQQLKKFEQLTGLARVASSGEQSILAELEAGWAMRQRLFHWLCAVEESSVTLQEQSKYVESLEKVKAVLEEERDTLSRLDAGVPIPLIKRGHLLSFLRFLRRKLSWR